MSLQAQSLEPIPELTSRIARASFLKGTLVMQLRDALGPIYEDADFADLFPKRERAAEAPWRLALVSVLQAPVRDLVGVLDQIAKKAPAAPSNQGPTPA